MTATATLRLPYATEEAARRVQAALQPDDDAFVTTRREGLDVVVEMRGPDLRALLRAVDDVLAQVSVSEDLLK